MAISPQKIRNSSQEMNFEAATMASPDPLRRAKNLVLRRAICGVKAADSARIFWFDGRLAQRLEHPAYTGKVRGSNP